MKCGELMNFKRLTSEGESQSNAFFLGMTLIFKSSLTRDFFSLADDVAIIES